MDRGWQEVSCVPKSTSGRSRGHVHCNTPIAGHDEGVSVCVLGGGGGGRWGGGAGGEGGGGGEELSNGNPVLQGEEKDEGSCRNVPDGGAQEPSL